MDSRLRGNDSQSNSKDKPEQHKSKPRLYLISISVTFFPSKKTGAIQ
jgi:hypothetical protein